MSSTITLRVPESLYARVKVLAKNDGVSLNQYVQLALTEKAAREDVLVMVEGRFNDLAQDLLIQILGSKTELETSIIKERQRIDRVLAVLQRQYPWYAGRSNADRTD